MASLHKAPSPETPPLTLSSGSSNNNTQHRGRARAKRQSVNQSRTRAPRPAVIASILDSFDAWELPAGSAPTEDSLGQLSPASSRLSQRYSWDYTASPQHSARSSRSRDFSGMPHSIGTLDEDREFDATTDAALSPSVPTSRPPSGLSQYTRSSVSRFSFDFGRLRRRSSVASQASAHSTWKERESVSKNILSAESWVRQGPADEDEDEDGGDEDNEHDDVDDVAVAADAAQDSMPSATPHLRRMGSREALRVPLIKTKDRRIPPLRIQLKEPEARIQNEQVIPKTPTTISSARGRLYLSDDLAAEDRSRSPSVSEDEDLPSDTMNRVPAIPARVASRRSHITDSVPTRTSSLSQKRSSSKKRSGRSRGTSRSTHRTGASQSKTSAERLTSPEKEADSIPDSTWADLGEDDSTVKRILQLRELRSQRKVEESKTLPVLDAPSSAPPVVRSQSLADVPSPLAFKRNNTIPSSEGDAIEQCEAPRLSRSWTVDATNTSRSETKRRIPKALDSDRSYHSALQKLNASTGNTPTSPLSPRFDDVLTLDVPQSAKGSLKERRRSVVQAFRPSSDRGRSLDNRPGSEPRPELPNGRGGLFPARSQRRSIDRRGPSLSDTFSKKGARSPNGAHNGDAHNVEDHTNGLDSIELAISDYLGAERLSRRIIHPHTGREICFSDVGDPHGAVVLVCVGMGLTRYVTAFFDELAVTLGLRLITLDRPGVGGSQPYPSSDKSGPLNWPDDVLAVCQHLGVSSFSLLAHSAGAIYALATALVIPHLVRGKVHLLAPWVPLSQLEVNSHPDIAPPAGAVPRSQRILRALPASFLKAANSSFMTASSASLKPVSKRQLNTSRLPQRREQSPVQVRDRANRSDRARAESMILMDQTMPSSDLLNGFPSRLVSGTATATESLNGDASPDRREGDSVMPSTSLENDPAWYFSGTAIEVMENEDRERQLEYMSELTLRTWELATRDSNPATDLLVCLERNRDIGFRYTDVNREIVITHGSEDKRVPVGNVKWLAEQVNLRAKLEAATKPPSRGDMAPASRDGWVDNTHAVVGCELRVLDGEGHGLMASASIMSDVLTEIAAYHNSALAG